MYLNPNIKICVTSLQGLSGSPVKSALVFMCLSCAEGIWHLLPETFQGSPDTSGFSYLTCKIGIFFPPIYLKPNCAYLHPWSLCLWQCASGSAIHLVSGTWDLRMGLSRCLMTDTRLPVQPPPTSSHCSLPKLCQGNTGWATTQLPVASAGRASHPPTKTGNIGVPGALWEVLSACAHRMA